MKAWDKLSLGSKNPRGRHTAQKKFGFRVGIETAAEKVETAAVLLLDGKILPSCQNPILVAEALRVLAKLIREECPPKRSTLLVGPTREQQRAHLERAIRDGQLTLHPLRPGDIVTEEPAN